MNYKVKDIIYLDISIASAKTIKNIMSTFRPYSVLSFNFGGKSHESKFF